MKIVCSGGCTLGGSSKSGQRAKIGWFGSRARIGGASGSRARSGGG